MHMVRAKIRAKVGVMINMEMKDVAGHGDPLMNNLTTSAVGCNRPYGTTLFGPSQSCM